MAAAVTPPRLRLPTVVQTLGAMLSVDAFPKALSRYYPDTITMRFLVFGDLVSTRDPALIKALFAADPDLVEAGSVNAIALGRQLGPSSLLLRDRDEHLHLRRLMLPPFHGEAVRAYDAVAEDITRAAVRTWPRNRLFTVLPHTRAIALEVMLRAVLGVRDDARHAALRRVLPRILQVNPLAVILDGAYPSVADGRVATRLPWVRAQRELAALLRQEIAAHRIRDTPGDDVLALLLAARDEDGEPLTDDALRDQLVTLLVAGNETTSASLAWAFERLARHPAVLDRLTQEVRGADGDATPYLDATVKETLRARPIIDVAWRRVTQPMTVGRHALAADTIVACSIRTVQRTGGIADPDAFRPERFLDDGPAPPPFTNIPFGGGRRRCLGASFATMELKAALRTVLREVDLQPTTARPERQSRLRTFATVPARGARIVVTTR